MSDAAHVHAHDHDHVEVNPATWTDPKRYAWLLGLLVPLLPFMAWGLVALTGLGVFWYWGPLFIFGVMPFLDTAIGKDSSNPPDSVVKYLEQDRYYRCAPTPSSRCSSIALVGGAALLAGDDLGIGEKLGLALTLGCVNGIGINTAHELGHKRASLERWLSKVALAPTGYGHFYIEHNRGHHVRVATPEDPASSRMGESFYRFWPRTVAGSLRSSWELEAERLERDEIRWFSPRNDIINAWAMTLVLFAALAGRLRDRAPAVADHPGGRRVLAPGSRQLPGALRAAAREARRRHRPLRAHAAAPQLELRQRVVQRVVVPLAAPLRPPRAPDAPLPGAAPLRRGARAALRLRDDDPAGGDPAAVAPRHGPARRRALRGRPDAARTSTAASATGCCAATLRRREHRRPPAERHRPDPRRGRLVAGDDGGGRERRRREPPDALQALRQPRRAGRGLRAARVRAARRGRRRRDRRAAPTTRAPRSPRPSTSSSPAAAQHPLVRAIVGEGEGADELLELFTIRGRSVLDAAADHLAARLRTTWPALSPTPPTSPPRSRSGWRSASPRCPTAPRTSTARASPTRWSRSWSGSWRRTRSSRRTNSHHSGVLCGRMSSLRRALLIATSVIALGGARRDRDRRRDHQLRRAAPT